MSMIDLSTVAAPDVVQPIDFEAVLAAIKAELLARLPSVADVLDLESEPLVKLMQVMAYREVLLRQRVNEAARALMLAYAVGGDLEQLGANYGIARLSGEADARLRHRVQLAYNRLAAAGPAEAYRQHALGVSADIRDVQVFSEAPGRVTVSVLALARVPAAEASPDQAAAGQALFGASTVPGMVNTIQPNGGPLLLQVLAALNAENVRPLTDHVVVRARRNAALLAYLRSCQTQGTDVTRAGITAALVEPAVKDVRLAAPLDNVVTGAGELAVCIGAAVSIEAVHA